ncbi:hypothetical protein HMPREF0185_01987 [Brevundimonas diminuta 470-4]|nr:hypothetical protein HMPREF0185_01987 [Brevundimonas diminuta 470-4]
MGRDATLACGRKRDLQGSNREGAGDRNAAMSLSTSSSPRTQP